MTLLPDIPGLRLNPPASEEALSALEKRLGFSLPTAYRRFLRVTDGFSLGGGLLMYSTEEIEERNATYEVQIYSPGYLSIGDTGGGEAILIRQDDDEARLQIVGMGVLTPDDMRMLAPSLWQWMESGFPIPR
jgi:hypothetical protein